MAFPKDFYWGAASSAAQIEGAWDEDGKCPSIWDVAGKHIRNGDSTHVCADHYHRFQEDVALMRQIGLKSYRFSVSWCRVMPERGKINQRGLDFYRHLTDSLVEAGIEPMVTLYHWDLPLWLHREGGWKQSKVIDDYLEYADAVVRALSGKVRWWMTLNEPQVFITSGYLAGDFAPFERSPFAFRSAVRNALLAHGNAVRLIRERAQIKPMIGLAMAASAWIPDTETAKDIADAQRASFQSIAGEIGNALYADPIARSKASPIMRNVLTPKDLVTISEKIDFIGVNVYQPLNALLRNRHYLSKRFPKSALGWVIDGRCLYWTIRNYWQRYHLPVMVTENGVALNDELSADGGLHDPMRIRFLDEYLKNMQRAVDEGIPVLGYQHWALMDNLEWCHGFKPRFGLIHVDYHTQQRTLKDSAREYARIIIKNGEIMQ